MPDREQPVPAISVPWRMLGGLLLVGLALGMGSFLKPFTPTVRDSLLDTLSVLYGLFLALVCFRGLWSPLKLPPLPVRRLIARRFIPALLGMVTGWAAFALFIWQSQLLLTQQAPTYPSLFQMLSFGAYPFFIAAILLLPSNNLSGLSRLRILLDSLILMLTVATLYGYVILVPILVATRGTFLEKLVGSFLTAAGLVLLLCLLFVALQAVKSIIRQVVVLFTLAVLIILVGHLVFLSRLLSTTSLLLIGPNAGVLVSLVLVAVAAHTMRRVLSQETPADRSPAILLEETGGFARGKPWPGLPWC